jgi:hypothetical protein
MSQENLEVVRRAFESFNRRDLAAAGDAFDADVNGCPTWLHWRRRSNVGVMRSRGCGARY